MQYCGELSFNDGYIESFNSILKRDVIRRFEFDTFEEAIATIKMYMDFYNNEGVYSTIEYSTPVKTDIKCMEMKRGN